MRLRQVLQKANLLSQTSKGNQFRQETDSGIRRATSTVLGENGVERRVVIVPRSSLFETPTFVGEDGDLVDYKNRISNAARVVDSYVRQSGAVDNCTGFYPQQLDIES